MQTINDVVLGVTQAGLSRYLNRRYGEKFCIILQLPDFDKWSVNLYLKPPGY